MTQVSIICLNHGNHFGIVWTSDEIGKHRFDICQNANHRYFHFYGGLKKPYPFSWIYPKNDFHKIKERVELENEELWIQEPEKEVQKFLQNWNYLVDEEFMPEFFFLPAHKEFGLTYENLPKYKSKSSLAFKEIFDNLTIDKDSFPNEHSLTEDTDIELSYKKELQVIAKRKDASISCQSIDRKLETDFIDQIENLLESKIIEQKWLAIQSIHYYIRGGIVNKLKFQTIFERTLLDDYYLIRKETVELLQTVILIQPDFGIDLLKNFLDKKNINIKLFAIKLLKKLYSFFNYLDGDKIYLENPYKIRLKLSHRDYLLPLYEQALDIQQSLFKHFERKNTLWNDMQYFEKEEVLERISNLKPREVLMNLNHALRLHELRKPFKEFYS